MPTPSQASPAGEDEKPSSPWMFCRLSLLRLMSYLPLLLVPAFGHRFRLSLSVAPPFGSECLTSFADVMTCRVGGGASGFPDAGHRPPLKPCMQFSRTRLSRRLTLPGCN